MTIQSKPLTTIEQKIVLITGGAIGIGKEIARAFLEVGATVIITHLKTENTTDFLAYLEQYNGIGEAIETDFLEDEAIEQLFIQIEKKWEKIHILVNNAGLTKQKPFFQLTRRDFLDTLEINLIGMFLCSQKAAKLMLKYNIPGRIINISSIHSQATSPGYVHYSSSKGGVNALTKAMAVELAGNRITVNAIAPGMIEVERFIQPEYNREEAGKYFPIGRVGLPADIAAFVIFLASEQSGYMTGETLFVNGGLSASE